MAKFKEGDIVRVVKHRHQDSLGRTGNWEIYAGKYPVGSLVRIKRPHPALIVEPIINNGNDDLMNLGYEDYFEAI